MPDHKIRYENKLDIETSQTAIYLGFQYLEVYPDDLISLTLAGLLSNRKIDLNLITVI